MTRFRGKKDESGAVSVEGVIKYRLHFSHRQPPEWPGYACLNAWRRILFLLKVIGQDERRYGGLGFGNVSERIAKGFMISATQTGGMEILRPDQYCLVQKADLRANLIIASGMAPPSSEALTHAAAYEASPVVRVVLHGHSPDIWAQAERLGLAATPEGIDYGTPAMAKAVANLVKSRPGGDIIVMRGHPDGFLAYGVSARQVGRLVVETLANAWASVGMRG